MLATVSLPLQVKGNHSYTVLYVGDSSHVASTSSEAFVTVSEIPVAIAITSPVNGATLSVPAVVPLAVSAVPGSQTTIKRVAYSANGTVVGISTTPPFGFSWGLFTPGSYTLTATSTTETGQTATAAPITVTAVGTPGAGLVTYFHQDLSGNTIAATDGAGTLIFRENYRPYGERLVKDSAAQIGNVGGNRQWFHGKVEDANTGLQYFGARYYDPVIGRFMGVDPVGVDPGNLHSGNRYAYGNNNPYRYSDPDGRESEGIMARAVRDSQFLGAQKCIGRCHGNEYSADHVASEHELGPLHFANEVVGMATGGALLRAAGKGANSGSEVVQRWMSKAELKATEETQLLRGGRDGTHYVTDTANADPLRARQRSALPQTPEVRVTLEVPSGRFSAPSKVEPRFNMPGGGMERTASGKVPVKILGVD